ncbi:MAG: hypothetical protein GTO18_02645 [Anaerolineales bacterium]|nr:hypothetical protein [Anaerolineales bacterium]
MMVSVEVKDGIGDLVCVGIGVTEGADVPVGIIVAVLTDMGIDDGTVVNWGVVLASATSLIASVVVIILVTRTTNPTAKILTTNATTLPRIRIFTHPHLIEPYDALVPIPHTLL